MMLEQSANRWLHTSYLYRRLEMLEPEGAEVIRPKREECVEDSEFFTERPDDVQELTERCLRGAGADER
jgi:hypothetical protein